MLPDATTGHDVKVERLEDRVLVVVEGEIIADTTSAIRVFETGLEPVIYIPKNDVKEIDLIKCGDYDCPYKGHAEFYTIRHGAHDIENAAWSYSSPIQSFPELEGRVAFYPHKVQEIKVCERSI
jgi:uncharacterized protein (DUF427 family)